MTLPENIAIRQCCDDPRGFRGTRFFSREKKFVVFPVFQNPGEKFVAFRPELFGAVSWAKMFPLAAIFSAGTGSRDGNANIRGYFWIFGNILEYLGIFGDIWEYSGIFGDGREYLGIFGDIWEYFGIFGDIWDYLGYSGLFGDILIH